MDERALFFEESKQELIDKKVCFNLEKVPKKEIVNKFNYKNLREFINIFCNFSLKITYICFGFLQFSVIWSYFLNVFRIDNIFTFLISLVLGFFPFVGTFLGIYGAHICWKWSLSYSTFIFTIPYLIIHGPMFMIILFEAYKDIKCWHSKKVLN